ncbi:MAG TPA: acyl-CoA dehydrogenase family protein [Microthrixaceae bacterium]|nr:acyl-CoA dehydrogenase family protein [Microthrixaceae bacterium]HMT24707.1 acyl-CoA dehydrogenase family protein [Microthrixaceae bacterium]HMT61734.1 acyl-CoA dehydrogenase family protein [Microthrixaceae bacterium]
MNPDLPPEAIELRESAARAFADLGGCDVTRRAEADPSVRQRDVAPLLAQLGVGEIDPLADATSLAAAAAMCAAAGAVALPYPLASVLVRDRHGRPVAAIPAATDPAGGAYVDHGDLFPEWAVGSLAGRPQADGAVAVPSGAPLGTKLGPFVVPVALVPAAQVPAGSVPAASAGTATAAILVQQTLVAWTVLGAVEQAVRLAVEHVRARVQFGKPLAAFQAVQFQIADASVAVAGLRELAAFTLWRLGEHGTGAHADVLALRLHALDTARSVLRTAQQLHGAAGVCDEYDVSVLARMVQPALRLPSSTDRAVADLAEAIALDGFDGLFAHGLRR